MGLLFASPAPPRRAERQTGCFLPEIQKSQSRVKFAISTTMGPLRSSKKRPQANRAHHCVKEISFVASPQRLRAVECVVLSAASCENKGNSVEDSGHHSIRTSANDMACLFSLPTCEEPHDHRDDD